MGYEVMPNQMPFKEGRPSIAIARGKLRLSRHAVKAVREAGWERLLILWDQETRKLAIARAERGDKRACQLNGQRVLRFPEASFRRKIGQSTTKTTTVELVKEGDMFVAQLPAELR